MVRRPPPASRGRRCGMRDSRRFVFVFGAEGQGSAPARAGGPAISPCSIPPLGRVESLTLASQPRSCSTRRGASEMAEPTLYLFDGFFLTCTPAASTRRRSCATCSPAGSPRRVSVASSSSTGTARTSRTGRSRCARRGRRHVDRAAGRRAPRRRGAGCGGPWTPPCRARSASRCGQARVKTFLGELEPPAHGEPARGDLRGDRLDPATLADSSGCAAAADRTSGIRLGPLPKGL